MAPVALVTGGAVRVGRAISLGLADAGYDTAINFHRSEAAARDVASRVEEMGRRSVLCRGDVSDSSAVERIADQVRRDFGRLDLLVNNASTFDGGPLLDVEEEEWDHTMGVNVKGPFLLARAVAGLLAESGGSIVNIVDLSAFRPWAEYPRHSVSKSALLHLTRATAMALAPRVRVNAVAPGTVLSPEEHGPEEKEASRRKTLLKKLGTPDDVVRTVLFLAGSPFITGEVIVVDGGRRWT